MIPVNLHIGIDWICMALADAGWMNLVGRNLAAERIVLVKFRDMRG